jgi:tetratricopeptide (TPR) repeat protein
VPPIRLLAALLAWLLPLQQAADLASYKHAIDDYRAGDAGAASNSVNPSMAARAAEPSSGWTAADLAAAAMRHTDAALQLATERRRDEAAAHVEAALGLLHAAVGRDADRSGFARRWCSTVAALLQAAGQPGLASTIADDAGAWLKRSDREAAAAAAYALGLSSEIHAAVAGPLSGPPPRRITPVPEDARHDLAEAARHYEDALAADPHDGEAALHLGRVLLLLGRDADAERPLRIALAAPNRPVRYLALMFLGAMAEGQARFGEAERQYRAARDEFAWGQSAPLALSHLLMRDGREVDAREAVAHHLAASGGRVVEPLWTYLADPATDLGPTLNLLRAEVWR